MLVQSLYTAMLARISIEYFIKYVVNNIQPDEIS